MKMAKRLIRYTFSIVITFVLLSFLRPSNSSSAQLQAVPIDPTSLPSISETWGDHLIMPSDQIPVGSYLAIYFRTSQPDTVIYKENVPKAVIQYSWSDFQNINSEEFGGYWVGDFDFEEEEVRSFHISQGHATSRILVDGRVIYEGSSSKVIPVRFTAGRHRIEIQHINNWHTVGYSAKLLPQNLYDGSPPNPTQSSTIWYAGIYEASSRNAEVTVRLKPAPTPIHLYLGSYEAVTWNVEQTLGAELAGVYFSSYSPGTEVQFSAQAVPVQEISLPDIYYSLEPNCSEHGATLFCDTPLYIGDNFKESISNLTGGFFASGFSGQYSADVLDVPDRFLSESDYDELTQQSMDLEQDYQEKIKRQEFDEIFNR
ncbi:MAG: hypothetical protein AAFR24_19650 [Cyanobacteria bacterium J06627_3]